MPGQGTEWAALIRTPPICGAPAEPFQLLLSQLQLASVKATRPHRDFLPWRAPGGFVLHVGQEELAQWNLTKRSPQQQEEKLIAFSTKGDSDAAPGSRAGAGKSRSLWQWDSPVPRNEKHPFLL